MESKIKQHYTPALTMTCGDMIGVIYGTEVTMDNIHTVLLVEIKSQVKLLCFWTLSIVLSLSKNRPVYFSKHNVSETGFFLRLQVKPTQFGPIDRASAYLRTPVPAPRWGT
jgi:hypothetical protein